MPDYKDVIKSAEKTDKFLESSIKHHKSRLQESIKTLEKNIINMTSEFKTTDGSLLGPRVNMKQAQKIHSQLTTLFDETYGKEAREVVKGFNQSANYIKKSFKDLDIAMDFTSVDKDMIKTLKKSTWGNFNQFGLQAQERLVDTMYNSILGKQPFSNLVDGISAVLTGFRDKRGRSMSTYADLYANDAIMDFHNAVHIKKAEDLGFKYFLYYGNAMANTRDFCRERLMKVFSKEEIESWDFPWGGKSGPAMTNRGGYNCRHHWRPVRKNWVDEDKLSELAKEGGEDKLFVGKEKVLTPFGGAQDASKLTKKQINSLETLQLYEDDPRLDFDDFMDHLTHAELNGDLRNKKILYKGLSNKQKKVVNNIDEAFKSATGITEDMIVYRGDNFYSFIDETSPAFIDRGFLSTTIDKGKALEFTGYPSKTKHLARIKVPKGTKGLDMTKLNSGDYAHEKEILFPRGSKLKVTKVSFEEGVRTVDLTLEVSKEFVTTEKKLAEKVVKETKGKLPLMTSADKFKGCLS